MPGALLHFHEPHLYRRTCSLENVEAGHTELLRYYESVSKHRGLILKLFGVMVAIVLIVGLVARR